MLEKCYILLCTLLTSTVATSYAKKSSNQWVKEVYFFSHSLPHLVYKLLYQCNKDMFILSTWHWRIPNSILVNTSLFVNVYHNVFINSYYDSILWYSIVKNAAKPICSSNITCLGRCEKLICHVVASRRCKRKTHLSGRRSGKHPKLEHSPK